MEIVAAFYCVFLFSNSYAAIIKLNVSKWQW